MPTAATKPRKRYDPDMDDIQRELYKKFPDSHFLSDPVNCEHFLSWNTLFRRNYHLFATDYLGLKLYEYQELALYELGVNNKTVIIASRAAAKSFLIALYACIRCILYPGTKILLSSATKGQSELIINEKIKNELMAWSPMLAREIESIKDNKNNTTVSFKDKSKIVVVVANDNARGNRSNCIVREEFRQIPKIIDDKVLTPCQILRQPLYANNPYYENVEGIKEEPVDIYISSSYLDNGNWMWQIVDGACKQMLEGKPACVMAFDEAVVLKHKIKSREQLIDTKMKMDSITWQTEIENSRLKESQSAFFTYSMLQKNQRLIKPFYPRSASDIRTGKKNKFEIPKITNEVRVVSCDIAFITGEKNDNSVFSCMRFLPEFTTVKRGESENVRISNGYRRAVPYMEKMQGGDVTKQALRIRQLFDDFNADYIVLDTRNGGATILDLLGNIIYDEERGKEYTPLVCMNNESYKERVGLEGSLECIYAINATQKLNSDIAQDFRIILESEKIDLPVTLETAKEELLPNIREYVESPDADTQIFYESPYLEAQALISETASLVYERNDQTGVITVKETGRNRKDRYTSVSYGSYFATQLEKNLATAAEDYEVSVFIN